jgi:YfiH family protein
MNLMMSGDVTLCTFDVLAGVRHAVSARPGGVSPPPFDALNLSFQVDDDPANVRENRRRFAGAAHFRMEDVVATRQVHGQVVRVVDRTHRGIGADGPADESWSCDALVTADREVVLTGFAADCPLVLLASCDAKVVGLAHAGWRPLAGGILRDTVAAMVRSGADAGGIVAGIGPSIGPCCYEVGPEVKSAAQAHIADADAFFQPKADRWLMDLWGLCRKALTDCGVADEGIETGGLCSRCRQDLFYSHRGSGGRTGRCAAVIGGIP